MSAKRNSWLRRGQLVLTVAFIALLGGCARGCTPEEQEQTITALLDAFYGQSVTVTADDKTPPTIRIEMSAIGLTVDQTATTVVSRRVSDLPTTSFFAVVIAEDPEGVRKVCVQPAGGRQCTCGGIGTIVNEDYIAQCDGIMATPGQSATTKRTILYAVDVGRLNPPCNHGCTGRASFGLSATAENFSGQTVSTPGVVFFQEQ